MKRDFLNAECAEALSYFIRLNGIAQLVDTDILLDIDRTEEEYGIRLVRKVAYRHRYMEELLEIEAFPIVEVLTRNQETHYYPCIGIYDKGIYLRTERGEKVRLRDIGRGVNILWYQNIRPVINSDSEDVHKLVYKALSYVGYVEKPLFGNKTVFNRHYFGKEEIPEEFWWCEVFVWDVFRMCGLSDIYLNGGKTGFCGDVKAWAEQKGLVVTDEVRPGDLLLFHWDYSEDPFPSHIAITIKNYGNNQYLVVGGDTSCLDNIYGGYVNIRRKTDEHVVSVIRPNYRE